MSADMDNPYARAKAGVAAPPGYQDLRERFAKASHQTLTDIVHLATRAAQGGYSSRREMAADGQRVLRGLGYEEKD